MASKGWLRLSSKGGRKLLKLRIELRLFLKHIIENYDRNNLRKYDPPPHRQLVI